MLPDLAELSSLVKAVAGEEILPRFTHTEGLLKADGSIVTEADWAVQGRLRDTLAQRYPQYGLLGEEMDEDCQRDLLAYYGQGLWCLDPVDGTSNFASGFPFFCISLALLIGGQPRLGVVYDPIRDECFTAARGCGAWLNGLPLKNGSAAMPLNRCLAIVDFKRLTPALADRLSHAPPYCSHRYLGAGALEWCWLAAGRFQLYLHAHQRLWDFAAGALALQEAGGFASTLEGESLFPAVTEARSVVAAANRPLFENWLGALG